MSIEKIAPNIQISDEASLSQVVEVVCNLMQKNKLFVLDAEMGSGKTTFMKHLGAFLGVTNEITSPTFSLINEYITHDGQVFYHMDLYRIDDPEELQEIGLQEYLNSDKICFIEWANLAMSFIRHAILIKIELGTNEDRTFSFYRYESK